MVGVIKFNKERAQSFFGNLSRDLPKGAEMLIDDLLRFSARQYRLAAELKGIRNWRGDLYGSLREQEKTPRKTSRYSGYVFMPIHGVYLDSMRPHYVPLNFKLIKRFRHRHHFIRKWAAEKGILASASSLAQSNKTMEEALALARSKNKPILTKIFTLLSVSSNIS